MSKKVRSSESIAEEITVTQRKYDDCIERQTKLKKEISHLKKHIKSLEKQKAQREREELQEYALKRIADEKLPEKLIATLLDAGSHLRDKNIDELDAATIGQTVKTAYKSQANVSSASVVSPSGENDDNSQNAAESKVETPVESKIPDSEKSTKFGTFSEAGISFNENNRKEE